MSVETADFALGVLPKQAGLGEHSSADALSATVEALKRHLAATPRNSRPFEHASAAYRLGLAYAELPLGDQAANARKALACFEVAIQIFDPRTYPVEHARVLNAAGVVNRTLGETERAIELAEKAVTLFAGRASDLEHAASLNNLGLMRAESGAQKAAVAAYDQALDLLERCPESDLRTWAATLHNRGQAMASSGNIGGLRAAVLDYEAVLQAIDVGSAPYQFGLVSHSLGVAYSSLAERLPDESNQLFESAVGAFESALTVFTRSDFPFQHAMTKHNLGVALAGLGGIDNLRRSMSCLEDALAMLDARLHLQLRKHAHATMSEVDKALARSCPGLTHAEHFVHLLAEVQALERRSLLRDRFGRLVELPDAMRERAFSELALAVLDLGPKRAQIVIESELGVLMEWPNEHLEVFLRAQVSANASLGGSARQAADMVLDLSVTGALSGPQRVFVRDFLYSLGFVRP